ncbi:sigma-70 family RNA polymerase sigma factor [Thiolapillus sp.]|uniref:sigma-70 family RNA polymerase sigma factor n=3 Tax=Thiolapillus sp. TaxID=2017437 RepID=UPI0027E47C88|nr:sigma-70 family RNA polymerase sigma factor [Thiolapillus sp.]
MKYNCVVDAWQKHELELRGFVARQLGDPVTAEDLLQDAFLKAIGEGTGFCRLENPRAWLFRGTRNLLVDHYRRQKQTVDLDEEPPAPVAEIAAVDSLAECLPRALQDLDAADREAIELCDLEGMKQAEYARAKGISLAGAKSSRVQRACRRLKQALQACCQIRYDESGSICCYAPSNASHGERSEGKWDQSKVIVLATMSRCASFQCLRSDRGLKASR